MTKNHVENIFVAPPVKKIGFFSRLPDQGASLPMEIFRAREGIPEKKGGKRVTVKEIRESLIAQLQAKGADLAHFQSLVEDYCFYWKKEREMQKDIREKGLRFSSVSSRGIPFERENPSIKNAVIYNKQKLLILRELGLTTENCTPPEEEL